MGEGSDRPLTVITGDRKTRERRAGRRPALDQSEQITCWRFENDTGIATKHGRARDIGTRRLVPGTEGWICASERILEIAGTTHLLLETPDEFRTNFAASPIESAIQRLRERIGLIAVATCRKGHDLTTEFVKPACASWQ